MTPQAFWNKKILHWERSRYSKWLRLHPLSWPLRHRLNKAVEILVERAPSDWKLLELGCGSGWLADRVKERYRNYVGIDFADTAITKAQQRLSQLPSSAEFRFFCDDLLVTDFPAADLTIFLGVTDWLERNDLVKLFSRITSKHALFSFTDADATSRLSLYQFYRRQVDQSDYRARSYKTEEILAFLTQNGFTAKIVSPSSIRNPGVLVWATRS